MRDRRVQLVLTALFLFMQRSFYTSLVVQRGLKDEELGGYPVGLWLEHSSLHI